MSSLQVLPFPTGRAGIPAAPSRVQRCFIVRAEHTQTSNEDETLYTDKCGTYSKGILQRAVGLVDPLAWQTFRAALNVNGPRNSPAFDLECLDSSHFTAPPAPALASELYATELVELYWAALMRDVSFADYATSALAAEAATELSSLPAYRGPKMNGEVTPAVLFRGTFPGETIGPYLSQFLIRDAAMGYYPVTQKYGTLKKGIDYMKDPGTFQQVQNGISTGLQLQADASAYLHNGRGLAAYTRADVLYQAWLTACLVLNTLNVGDAAPFNPGYCQNGSVTWRGWNTRGKADIAATLAAVVTEALKAAWFQKWYVHLRHRPESGGALVYLNSTGQGNSVQGKLSSTVIKSRAVKANFKTNGTYFLPQAFPEGSPTHPAYPSGQGTVAGACITALKFFFDGSFPIPAPQVPSSDGSTLGAYTGRDAGRMTVNGELNKLAHNISFGHGIHAGTHWRSDTDASIELGEAVALSVLQDQANTCKQRFTVKIQKVDGTTAIISNQ